MIYRIDVLQYILIPIINSVRSINLKKDGMTSRAKYCYEKAIHVVMISFLWTSRFFFFIFSLIRSLFFFIVNQQDLGPQFLKLISLPSLSPCFSKRANVFSHCLKNIILQLGASASTKTFVNLAPRNPFTVIYLFVYQFFLSVSHRKM